MSKIMIASLIRDREEILPIFLESLYNLEYDKSKIELLFIINNCSTNKPYNILSQFKIDNYDKYKSITLIVKNFENPPLNNRKVVGRDQLYINLAILRNIIIDCFIASDCDYLFEIDSDILCDSNTLNKLLSHNKDCVSALVRNSESLRAYNFMFYSKYNDRYYRKNIKLNGLIEADLIGAITLFSKQSLLNSRYSSETSGEDEGLCKCLIKQGFKLFVDCNLKTRHIYNIDKFLKNGETLNA